MKVMCVVVGSTQEINYKDKDKDKDHKNLLS